jgi:hypothetical protein
MSLRLVMLSLALIEAMLMALPQNILLLSVCPAAHESHDAVPSLRQRLPA